MSANSSRELTVSASYVGAFCEFLGRHGVPTRLARRVLGPEPNGEHPFARVAHGQVWTLFERWAGELGNRHLGLQFGAAVGGAGFGLLGIAAASAASLHGAMLTLLSTESLVSSVGRAYVRTAGDDVALCWREHVPGSYGSALFSDAVLAGWVSFARFIAGERLPIRRVRITHAVAGSREAYEAVFGCAVETGADENAIEFSRELLPVVPRYANVGLHRTLLAWCRDCSALAALPQDSALRRTADAIAARCGGSALALDEIVAEVAQPRRTLQRHLAREGLSFRRLLECVRVTVATSALLRSDEAILGVGERTGFAEQASFSRTFRKWTGVSPSEFRRLFPRGYAELRDAR